MTGPDHISSVEPRGLELIVKYSKSVWQALGISTKLIHESEIPQREKYGVSVVSRTSIKQGDLITPDKITVKCPGGGISPVQFESLMGKTATRNIEADCILFEGDVK